MSIHLEKHVGCDYCKRRMRVNNVAAPPMPKGWQYVRVDFYGNEVHCCDRQECFAKHAAFMKENKLGMFTEEKST